MRNKLTKQNLEHENEKLNWKQEKKKHKLGKQTRNKPGSKTGNRHRDTDLSKGDTGDARQETRGMKHVGQTSRQNQRTRKT